MQPRLISLHYICSKAVEHNVLFLEIIVFQRLACQELLEAIECRGVCFGRSHPAVLFELYYRAFHKIEQGVFLGIAVELVDHIICRIDHTARIEPSVNLGESLHVPSYALTDRKHKRAALALRGGSHHRAAVVPFRRKNLIVGNELAHFSFADNLVVNRALVARNKRWPEFHFNRSHCLLMLFCTRKKPNIAYLKKKHDLCSQESARGLQREAAGGFKIFERRL